MMPLLISDSFTDTNGTALASHSPNINTTGNPWVQLTGACVIQSNRVDISTTSEAAYARAVIETSISNCAISLVVRNISASLDTYAGVLFRCVDNTSALFFGFDTTDLVRVFKLDGTITVVASAAFTHTTNVDYLMQVTCAGSSIICKIDGTTYITTTSTYNQAATRHGLQGYFATGGSGYNQLFDDFSLSLPFVAPAPYVVKQSVKRASFR